MTELQLLATAMGLSALAGLNLYLTVFILSLSLNLGWIHLGPGMEHLHVMAHPAILIVSGVMTLVEFIADKWPWFDSLWDAVHTVIRPAGGVILGLAALAPVDPRITVLAGLFCGSITLGSHLAKAGTRLVVNASPEPFSNSIVSVTEDLIVVGGLSLVYLHPFIALGVLLGLFALFLWLAPLLFRHMYHSVRFILLKLRSIGAEEQRISQLPEIISSESRDALESRLDKGEALVWSVPVVIGRVPGLPRNRKGYLGFIEPSKRLAFIVKTLRPVLIGSDSLQINSEIRMLYDQLTFSRGDRQKKYSVRFAKNHRAYFEKIREELRA